MFGLCVFTAQVERVACRCVISNTSASASLRPANSPPTLAACPKCNVVLLTGQPKRRGSGEDFIGGLLILVGLVVAQVFNGLAGLVCVGLGILVVAGGGRRTVMICPSCGAWGETLGEIAAQFAPPEPKELRAKRLRSLTLAVVIGATVVILWIVIFLK
jgi:hypothetical protein